MASTRKPKRAERASRDLLPSLRGQLADRVPSGSRIVVALSGGADSVVLLDLLQRLAKRRTWRLSALHVNHQLQPAAADWAKFCRRLCRAAGVPLKVVKVGVPAGNSVEGNARRARYAALLAQRADYVALAHNQDDQAETVLLHLLRGAGVRGLVGMQPLSAAPFRVKGRETARLLRPLLDVPRSAIERYAAQRKLAWVEDPSNASVDFTRNFLRVDVLPRLAQRFPAYREALVRTARHAAEAARLLDEFAQQDGAGDALSTAVLRKLTPLRAKNALGAFLRRHDVDLPSADRLDEALRQLLKARREARVCIAFGDRQLRVHDGRLVVAPALGAAAWADRTWRGEPSLALPELRGTLLMERTQGAGISLARLAAAPVTVRLRRGGERLRPRARGATRTVKNLMQEARMPVWERERLPFIYCGEALVCVPGLAIDSAFAAVPSESAVVPVWRRD